MKPFVYDITGITPLQAFLAVKHMPYSLLLDSADEKHDASRYSYVVCQPIETIEAKDGLITVTNWEQRLSFRDAPFKILKSRIESWIPHTSHITGLPPFQGGAAGLFGYDLGRYIEDLPKKTQNNALVPDMAIGIYDQVLAHDNLLKKTCIFTHARNAKEAEKKRNHLINLFSQNRMAPPYTPSSLEWRAQISRKDYEDNVQKVIDYIHAGDIFQANLSQRFTAELPLGFDPFVHYMHMRKTNPVPFGAYMNLGEIKIASASPERFISVNNGKVTTCPIKGTRPRSNNIVQDRALREDLQTNQKDRAENTMIVDLLRNDLSKTCIPNSINVEKLCELESFPGVHHLVSTITAMLTPGKTAVDLLGGCFPGGSITGAPKIRAMEIIEELEITRRGPYCGCIGFIGFDDTMDTNILIRTLIYENNKTHISVGGGITADSNPADEYDETLDKARSIMLSFETAPKEDSVSKTA